MAITTKIVTTHASSGWSIAAPPVTLVKEGNIWYVFAWGAGETTDGTPNWARSISAVTTVPLLPFVLRHTHVLSVLMSLDDVIAAYRNSLVTKFGAEAVIEQKIYLGPVTVEEDLYHLPKGAIDVNKSLHTLSIGEFETVKADTHDAVVYCMGCSAKVLESKGVKVR